jgi:hypothetical protein
LYQVAGGTAGATLNHPDKLDDAYTARREEEIVDAFARARDDAQRSSAGRLLL